MAVEASRACPSARLLAKPRATWLGRPGFAGRSVNRCFVAEEFTGEPGTWIEPDDGQDELVAALANPAN